jgi:uncharacterized membrane protein YccC
MAAFVRASAPVTSPSIWLDRLEQLLARELAPTAEKFRTSLRLATVATVGVALVAICHVNSEIGAYIVWLLVGAGPMMSVRKAGAVLVAEAAVLAASVVLARLFAETPWLMLPFLFAFTAVTTYAGMKLALGAGMLLIQVVSLGAYYGVAYAPREIGWAASGAFAGSVIAFGVLVLFDNWLWPDPADAILMKVLGSSIEQERTRFVIASLYYLGEAVPKPRVPPPTSDLPAHLALLDRAVAEGATAHRRAVFLAAITRVARIHLEVDRLIVAAREDLPREIRSMLQPELRAAVDAIATALAEIARETPTFIRVGVDVPPPASRVLAGSEMEALRARVIEVRPIYIRRVGAAEVANFASFTDCLAAITEFIERLLDEPPTSVAAIETAPAALQSTDTANPALVQHSQKVGLCVVIAYMIGLVTHRVDLTTILITVLITALPTYGASLRKMILRIIGAVIGGVVSLAAIMIVTPNFDTLPVYLITVFLVLYLSAYSSLTSGRVAYAGKQLGTTFMLIFAGLSPSADIYTPLWRIWGILLGTLVVTIVFLLLWPTYAGDSLLPRLRKVIRDTLDLMPGGLASHSEAGIQATNSETMRVLAEILEVADDADLEGRASMIDHDSVIQAAGNLRRIANRLTSIATGHLASPHPQLDEATEAARATVMAAIRARLQSWLDFFSGDGCLSASTARALAASHSREAVARPLEQFSTRLEEGGFARLDSWTLEQRRGVLSDLHSMRRVEVLIDDLDRYLSRIPGAAPGDEIRVHNLRDLGTREAAGTRRLPVQ